jgi:O-antigen/teichoic acid export membrane protein
MMKRTPYTARIRWLALVTLLAFSPAAFAYLDPSTGSMVVSAIVGIFASIALAVKTYWYKIKGWFRRDERKQDEAPQDSQE